MKNNHCKLMKSGIKFLAINKFDEALLCFEKILELDEDNYAALNNKSLSLNGLNRFKEAINNFDKILYYDCKFYFSLIGKGESLYFLEYYDSALDYFNRALDVDCQNDLAWYGKAKVFYKLQEFKNVVVCLNNIKKISGNSWLDDKMYKKSLIKSKDKKFNRRAELNDKINKLLLNKEYDTLLGVLKQALEFDEKSTFFLCNMAYVLYKLSKYDDALRYIDIILKIDFMNLNALKIQSKIFIELNDYNKALTCLDSIIEYGGDVDTTFYQEVISNSDDSTQVNYLINQGNYYLIDEDYDEALCCFDEALDIDYNNIVALNNKGFTLYLLNKYEEAIQIFDRVLSINDNYIYSLLGKSYSSFFLEDFKNSLECYNHIINQNSSFCDEDYLNLLKKYNSV